MVRWQCDAPAIPGHKQRVNVIYEGSPGIQTSYCRVLLEIHFPDVGASSRITESVNFEQRRVDSLSKWKCDAPSMPGHRQRVSVTFDGPPGTEILQYIVTYFGSATIDRTPFSNKHFMQINITSAIEYRRKKIIKMEEKKKNGSWEPQSLQTAIDKVMSKELSVRQAAMRYNIPKSTIHDKIKALNRGEEVTMKPKLGRFTNTFSAEYEQVLVDHIKDLSNRCMPLMKKEFLKLAYDLAEVMKVPHRFNKEKGSANFMKRHSDISLRASESTSMMRAVGFNKPQVHLFYDNLEKLMKQYKFRHSRVWRWLHMWQCDAPAIPGHKQRVNVIYEGSPGIQILQFSVTHFNPDIKIEFTPFLTNFMQINVTYPVGIKADAIIRMFGIQY
ncbi:hypothetical protein HW555_009740 [Spodoptera exigua]|uniref:HTH psq-type domain-containing protein n=1 Tax=Spodoptera exigua TaxID=7107 RepID=A0A835GBZ2_SPOEX|nr:hypothetical protein HW555_009740 [Spodoptera exigua]